MPLIMFGYHPVEVRIDGEIVRLRIKRMTIEEFEVFEAAYMRLVRPQPPALPGTAPDPAQAKTEAAEMNAWMRQAFAANVTLEQNQVVVDGKEIVSGEDLLNVFGGRLDVTSGILSLIWAENRLSDHQKKDYRSLLVSDDGLMSVLGRALSTMVPRPAAPGPIPEPTADAASAPATPATEDASETGTASPMPEDDVAAESSGTTVP